MSAGVGDLEKEKEEEEKATADARDTCGPRSY